MTWTGFYLIESYFLFFRLLPISVTYLFHRLRESNVNPSQRRSSCFLTAHWLSQVLADLYNSDTDYYNLSDTSMVFNFPFIFIHFYFENIGSIGFRLSKKQLFVKTTNPSLRKHNLINYLLANHFASSFYRKGLLFNIIFICLFTELEIYWILVYASNTGRAEQKRDKFNKSILNDSRDDLIEFRSIKNLRMNKIK